MRYNVEIHDPSKLVGSFIAQLIIEDGFVVSAPPPVGYLKAATMDAVHRYVGKKKWEVRVGEIKEEEADPF